VNTGSESHPSRTTAHGLETNKYSGGDIRNPVSTTSGNRLGATGAAGMAGSVVALPAVSDEVPSENRLGNTGVAGIGGNSGTAYGYQTNKGMSPSGSSVPGTTAHGYETNKYAKDVDHPTAMGGSSENRLGATGAAGVAAAAVGVGGVGAYEASKEGEGDDISRATHTERSYPLATHSDSSNVLTAGDAGLPGRPRDAGATGTAMSDTTNKLTAADVGLPGRSTGTGATDTLNTSTGGETSSGGVSSGTTALYGLTPLGAGAAAAVAGGTSQSAGTTSADPLSSQPIDSEGRYAPGHPTESSANREVDSYALDSANTSKQAATIAMAGGAGGAASSSQHESSRSGDRFFGRPPSSPPATQSTFSDRDALTAATVATGTGAAGAAGYDRYEHTTERAQLPVVSGGQPSSIPQRDIPSAPVTSSTGTTSTSTHGTSIANLIDPGTTVGDTEKVNETNYGRDAALAGGATAIGGGAVYAATRGTDTTDLRDSSGQAVNRDVAPADLSSPPVTTSNVAPADGNSAPPISTSETTGNTHYTRDAGLIGTAGVIGGGAAYAATSGGAPPPTTTTTTTTSALPPTSSSSVEHVGEHGERKQGLFSKIFHGADEKEEVLIGDSNANNEVKRVD